MTFVVRFTQERPARPGLSRRAERDLDTYDSLIMEACTVLEESGGCLFHLDGFGQENRWTDIGYDGSAFMEELPRLRKAIEERREHEVMLYPQGIERTLTFRPSGEQVVVHCQSWNNWWTPVPETEELSRQELLTMLDDLAADIATGLQAIGSELVERQPIKGWLGA